MILLSESSESYHDNPAIGSGDIRRAIISPQKYRDGMDGLCDRDSEAFAFGIAAHVVFLEPAKIAELIVTRPDDDRGNFRTKIGKAWRDEQKAAGRCIVDHDKLATFERMRLRMPAAVRAIFDGCHAEATVRTQINGLDVQCRPDLWSPAAGEWYDLKTIDCADKHTIERAIWSHRYDVQDAWIDRVIVAETGAPIIRSRFIFAEKNPPHRWRVVELDREYDDMANHDIDVALEKVAACRAAGRWDDDGDLRLIVRPPQYAGGGIDEDADGSLNVV